jgi:hypothetical protein
MRAPAPEVHEGGVLDRDPVERPRGIGEQMQPVLADLGQGLKAFACAHANGLEPSTRMVSASRL